MKPALFLVLANFLQAECIGTESDRIRAGDLAQAVPVLAALDPQIQFGYAPQLGVRRILRSVELEHFAARFGLHLESPPDLCVESATRRLNEEELLAAIVASAPVRPAQVQIVDFLRNEVPVGRLQGDRGRAWNLPAAPGTAPLLWQGWIEHGVGRRFPVWARVRVTVRRTRAFAARDLRPGETLESSDVRVETAEESLSLARSIDDPSALAGKEVRRTVRQGQPLSPEMLQAPVVVRKGQNVAVLVVSRLAALRLSATAETSARAGEFVILRNPGTGKRFRAQAGNSGTSVVRVGEGSR